MSSNFGYIDIILLAMIAGFIILRLRSILGRKTGHEDKIYPRFSEKKFEEFRNQQEVKFKSKNSNELEGEEKDWLIKDLREKLNEREKATATLTYLKYKKMRDEMQKLKMHGGPDDYLENLEKIKKEQGIDNLYKSYEDKKTLDRIKKHPEEIIKLK